MRKGVQCVVFVYREIILRNKHRSACAQRYVAVAVADGARAYRRRGVISRTRANYYVFRNLQLLAHARK